MVILTLLVISTLLCFGLAGYGFGTLGRIGVRQADRRTRLACAAALAGAAAVAVYAWGLLNLGLAVLVTEDSGTDAFPAQPCRVTGAPEAAADVVGHRVEYVPPRYVCLRQSGASYTTDDVPAFVGPAALGLAATAVLSALLTRTTPPTSPPRVVHDESRSL
ncbi:hypothetical protein [Streptomyces narbonensis]|uniref:hypothetical protein n=1 Tax=Streptomyces narbonensis TaxID=67333 RepID=UPI001674154C|nr:hypothetical protein [Streptomyces narbonensis]GGV98981.1 hypothetical protein GCM10010230_23820 [Streptomyces narbonensis]